MGNEFGAADLQPHLLVGHTITVLVAGDGTTEDTILAAGHHQKIRLREAFCMVVNAALGTADVSIDVKHGGNDAVAAHATGAVDSAIGILGEMTIVQQYADCDPDEALTVKNDVATTGNGDVLLTLTYEVVE